MTNDPQAEAAVEPESQTAQNEEESTKLDIDSMDLEDINSVINGIKSGEIQTVDKVAAPEPEAKEEPKAEPEAEAQPAEETPEPKAEEPEPEPEEAEIEKLGRYRQTARSKVGEEMHKLLKADQYLTEEEAISKAKANLGLVTEPKAEPPKAEPKATEPEPDTVEEPAEPVSSTQARAEIIDLKKQAIEARDTWDNETAKELELKALELEAKLPDLLQAEAQAAQVIQSREQEAAKSFDNTWDASVTEAASLYPDSAQEGSDLQVEMVRMDKELEQFDPELWSRPDKPLILAQRAAIKLKVPPSYVETVKADPVVKPTDPEPSQPARVPSATGAKAGATAPASSANTTNPNTLANAVDQIEDLDDLIELQNALGLR